jgi:hypothetical protein
MGRDVDDDLDLDELGDRYRTDGGDDDDDAEGDAWDRGSSGRGKKKDRGLR